MRETFNALWKTFILLMCSMVQVFEVIFRGIGEVFGRLSELLNQLSKQLMTILEPGKYETFVATDPEET